MSSFPFDLLSLCATAASGNVNDYFQEIIGDFQQKMRSGHQERETAPPSPFSLLDLGTPDVKPCSSLYGDNPGNMVPSPFSLSGLGSPDIKPYSTSYDDHLDVVSPIFPSVYQSNAEVYDGPTTDIYQDACSSLRGAATDVQVNADFATPYSPQGLHYGRLTHSPMYAPTPPNTPSPAADLFQGYQQNWIPSELEERGFMPPSNDPQTIGGMHDLTLPNHATYATPSQKDKRTRKTPQSTGECKFIYCQPVAVRDREDDSSTIRVLNCLVTQRKPVKGPGKPRIKIVYIDSDGTEKALYFRSCVVKPRALCKWGGCQEEVWTDRKSIREHMERAHGVIWIPKDRVHCRWPGCQNYILFDSLFRHITNSHMHVVRASCVYCGEDYSRIDCRSRHSPNCLLKRADF